MFLSSLSLILTMLGGTPRVAQWSPDIRQSSGAWIAGDGLTSATIRYTAPITVTPANIASEMTRAIDSWSDHPTVDWSTSGQDAETQSFNDNVVRSFFTIDQGPNGGSQNNRSYCFAFAARNEAGYSKAWIANRPTIFGLAGSDPNALTIGTLHCVRGRNLCSEFTEPALWLWDGVDSSKLIPIPILDPGGNGPGGTKEQKRIALFFEIPSSIAAGNYFLVASTSENQWSISNPKSCPVQITGVTDPTITERGVALTAASGTDITPWLLDTISKSKATDDAPLVIKLPAGVFYLSKTVELPNNVGIVGAGEYATTITPLPSLTKSFAAGNQNLFGRTGMFYIKGKGAFFRDLTLDLSPDDRRQTVRHLVIVGPGIDACQFRSVRFRSLLSQTSDGYCDGAIYRYGQQKYWRFTDCDWECQVAFEGRLDSTVSFASNGAFDRALFYGGSFRNIHGLSSISSLGNAMGRGGLIYGMDISRTRRGFTFVGMDACLEAAIVNCHFHSMKSGFATGETILHEARRGLGGRCKSATATTFSIDGDNVDRTRSTVIVLSGTGQYQYRVISSSAGGVHTVETPWQIVPDSTSQILVVLCATDCSYAWNRFENTFGGINFYGTAVGNIVSQNLFTASDEGVMLSTNADSVNDGISVQYWFSGITNWFDGGSGYHLVAPRTTADFKSFTAPQLALINLAFNQYLNSPFNQLWAGEGIERTADENSPTLQKFPTIDFVSDFYSRAYTVPHYLHRPLTSTTKPLWRRTRAGIGNFILRGNAVDDVTPDQESLIETPFRK